MRSSLKQKIRFFFLLAIELFGKVLEFKNVQQYKEELVLFSI